MLGGMPLHQIFRPFHTFCIRCLTFLGIANWRLSCPRDYHSKSCPAFAISTPAACQGLDAGSKLTLAKRFRYVGSDVILWGADWAWGLPLILLTVVIHVFGLGFINERVVLVLGRTTNMLRIARAMGASLT